MKTNAKTTPSNFHAAQFPTSGPRPNYGDMAPMPNVTEHRHDIMAGPPCPGVPRENVNSLYYPQLG